MTKKTAPDKRRHLRIRAPQGLWVAWQVSGAERVVSRVLDISLGGAYIVVDQAPPVGTSLLVLFSVPEGEIRATAVVHNAKPGEGMGVEFTKISHKDRNCLRDLIQRLLATLARR